MCHSAVRQPSCPPRQRRLLLRSFRDSRLSCLPGRDTVQTCNSGASTWLDGSSTEETVDTRLASLCFSLSTFSSLPESSFRLGFSGSLSEENRAARAVSFLFRLE